MPVYEFDNNVFQNFTSPQNLIIEIILMQNPYRTKIPYSHPNIVHT